MAKINSSWKLNVPVESSLFFACDYTAKFTLVLYFDKFWYEIVSEDKVIHNHSQNNILDNRFHFCKYSFSTPRNSWQEKAL